MSAKILLTYMAIGPHGPNNPLYNDEEDLENDLSSWEILLPSEKQEQAFEYLSYFAETFMDDYKYPMFSNIETLPIFKVSHEKHECAVHSPDP